MPRSAHMVGLCILIACCAVLLPWPQGTAHATIYSGCSPTQSIPVIQHGANGTWNETIGRPSVLVRNGIYNMWFTATYGSIGYANSTDGLHWKVLDHPVLSLGARGTWDGGGVYWPSVIWNGTLYLMYYTGSSTSVNRKIGLAFSSDGAHWTRYAGNPVLIAGPGVYDNFWVAQPSALYDSPYYKLWYVASSSNVSSPSIAYANSTDGIHWVKSPSNPVFASTDLYPEPIYTRYEFPSVAKIRSGYVMAFDFLSNQHPFQTVYSTSNDGLNWSTPGQPLLGPGGNSSSWDNAYEGATAVWYNGSSLLLWYSGSSTSLPGISSIGLVTCNIVLFTSTKTTTLTSSTTRVVTSTTTYTLTQRTTLTQTTSITTTQTVQVVPPEIVAVSVGLAAGLALAIAALIRSRKSS